MKNLSLYKHYPFDTFSSNQINQMRKDVHYYSAMCKTIMQAEDKINSSRSFLEISGIIDKMRQARLDYENHYNAKECRLKIRPVVTNPYRAFS